ncbi:SDR family oxidoreductase [Nannocystaceae bacterium ST9]
MIIVTGATGKLGSRIVDHLLARVPATRIGVSVRDPAKAAGLAARGVAVRIGDYDDPAGLTRSFEGATQVLIVSASTSGEPALRQHRAAIEAARRVGVRRILYTSHMGASPDSAFGPMPDHAATERMLEACGVDFVSLRNGFYAASAVLLLGHAFETGEVVAPEDGPVSWTTHADLAEAAAIALVDEHWFAGLTPPLTASRAHDLGELAAIASELGGRAIRRVTIDDDAYRERLVRFGVPLAQAEMLVGLFRASRRGEFAAVDPGLERVLGRPPQSMHDVLARALEQT